MSVTKRYLFYPNFAFVKLYSIRRHENRLWVPYVNVHTFWSANFKIFWWFPYVFVVSIWRKFVNASLKLWMPSLNCGCACWPKPQSTFSSSPLLSPPLSLLPLFPSIPPLPLHHLWIVQKGFNDTHVGLRGCLLQDLLLSICISFSASYYMLLYARIQWTFPYLSSLFRPCHDFKAKK